MNDTTPPTPTHVTPRTWNYLLRHWRGECSLAVSYWVKGWLAIIPVATIALLVSIASKEGRQPWL
jgi:hypothetical protein